jgi:hypothetical protein
MCTVARIFRTHLRWIQFHRGVRRSLLSNIEKLGHVNMIETTEQIDKKVIIQERYIKRVNVFFTQVKDWLTDTSLETVEMPTRTITDATGTYQVGIMAIVIKDKPELEDNVASIFPMGATTLLGEGILEIAGAFGEEKLIYFCRNTLQQVEYKLGVLRPIYRGVDLDGWYWLESSMSNRALLITRERFFDLIRMVSFHEFT